jgi:hypothetical protein
MGVKHVEAFGDSLLVMQQVTSVFQYFDGSLNAYLDICLELLLSSMILLCNMFLGMKIHWRIIWRSKHQIFDRIEEILIFFEKTGCSGLPNRTVQFLADAQCDSLFC